MIDLVVYCVEEILSVNLSICLIRSHLLDLAEDHRLGGFFCLRRIVSHVLSSNQILLFQNSLLSHTVRNEHLEEMVGNLVKIDDSGDVSPHDRLLLLEDSDAPVHLHVAELLILKVFECSGNLILFPMVENHAKHACVVIDVKGRSGGLVVLADDSTANDDLVHWCAINLENVVWAGTRIVDHLDCDGDEHPSLLLLLELSPCRLVTCTVVLLLPSLWVEKALVVIVSELQG